MTDREFVKVARAEEIPEGRGKTVELDGFRIAVWKVGERYVAIQDACPHMGASLAEGWLARDRIVCRWHNRSFDVNTGHGDARSGLCARVFAVRVEGGDVLVERPAEPPAQPHPHDDGWIVWDPDRHWKRRTPDADD
jgi:nitrite reductase/ring-hydroxylating ferredoxin subunit